MDEFILFGQPNIGKDEINEVIDSLRNGWLGTGPKTKRFEEDFAKYKSSKFSLALNSCTAGLHLSCLTLDLKPGDEVITTAMTFCATVNSIIHAGGKPVLVDIDPSSWNIDCNKLEEKITSKTKAIIPVHFAGQSCDMKKIYSLSKDYGFKIIEDASHAIGGRYLKKPIGGCKFSDITIFSFHPVKIITTAEGGIATTNDKKLLNQMQLFRTHGITKNPKYMTKNSEGK